MDAMNAFERQVAGEVVQAVGPLRPVDDLAMFNHVITTTQSPKARFQSMFSATKFVLAGAIVALFGGFLLAGVLTQPSDDQLPGVGASPSATIDLLSTLVADEVEPGVFRVVSDGNPRHPYERLDHITIGSDGAVWVREGRVDGPLRSAGDVWRVGDATSLPGAPSGDNNREAYRLDTDAEGRLVEAYHGGLSVGRSRDDSAVVYDVPADFQPSALAALPDDTVWASWFDMEIDVARLGVLDAEGWTEHATPEGVESIRDLGYAASVSDIVTTPDGDVWVGIQDNWGGGFGGGALARFDGAEWTEIQPLAGTEDSDIRISDVHDLTVAPDGSLWVLAWLVSDGLSPEIRDLVERGGAPGALFRYDGQAWETYLGLDVLPGIDPAEVSILQGPIAVDRDGRVWASLERITQDEPTQRTLDHHLVMFDGDSTTYLPQVTHVSDLSVDDAGSLWAATEDGLYVITPEAVAATE